MAKKFPHRRITPLIWDNEGWRGLTSKAQWMYLAILTQKDLNYAGVVLFNSRRWSKFAPDMTEDQIMENIRELQRAQFVYFDDDTDEVLVRTYIRNDGVIDQPNTLRSACKSARMVASPLLREVLAYEMSQFPHLSNDLARTAVAEALEFLAPNGPVRTIADISPNHRRTIADTSANYQDAESVENTPSPQVDGSFEGEQVDISPIYRRSLGGGGRGYSSSNLKVKDAREEKPGPSPDETAADTSPVDDSFNESKNSDDAFTRFCEALPKPPQSRSGRLRMAWQAKCREHSGWRVLDAARSYAAKHTGNDRQYAKQALAFLESDELVELLPHRMQAYRGMDITKWLDMVTEQRDTGICFRYAGGEPFQPRWPDDVADMTEDEKIAFREIDKDRWFREQRDMQLRNLEMRYGGERDAG